MIVENANFFAGLVPIRPLFLIRTAVKAVNKPLQIRLGARHRFDGGSLDLGRREGKELSS